jgi:MoxR-like ATPase
VNSTSKAPFVLWGASGTGKSTLLAQAAKRIVEEHPDAMVITRFIGVTGKSSNGHTLLTDLARRLCKAYGGKVEEIPLDPTVLEARFRDYLATTTPEKPLVLLIDALDQFSNGDPYRHLKWLPTVLPENVRIVLSTLEVDCLDILKQREVSCCMKSPP